MLGIIAGVAVAWLAARARELTLAMDRLDETYGKGKRTRGWTSDREQVANKEEIINEKPVDRVDNPGPGGV